MDEVKRVDDSEIQSIRNNKNEGAMEKQDKTVLVYIQNTDKVDSQHKTDKENKRLSSCCHNKKEPEDNKEPATLEIASTYSSSTCDNGNIVHLDDESDFTPNGDGNTNTGDSISNAGEGNSDTGNDESNTCYGRKNPCDGRPNSCENNVNFLITGLGCIKIKSDITEMGEPNRSEEKVSTSRPAKSQVDDQNILNSSGNLPVINSSPETDDMKEKERMVTQTKTTLREVTTIDQTTEKCFITTYCSNSPDNGSKIQALNAELKEKEGIINSQELQNSNKKEPTPTNEEVSSPREVSKLNEMQTQNEGPTQMDTPTPSKVLTQYAMAPGKVNLPSDVAMPNKLPVQNEVLSEVPQSHELLSQDIVPTHIELPSNNKKSTHNEQHTYNEESQCNLNAEPASKITPPQTKETCVTGQISKPLVEDGYSHTMQKKTFSEDQSSVNDKSFTLNNRGHIVNGEDTNAIAKEIVHESLDTLETSACNKAGEEIKRSLIIPSPLKYTTNTSSVVLPRTWNTCSSFKRQHHRPKKSFEQIPLDSWVPQVRPRQRFGKPYNERRRHKYIKTSVDQTKLDPLIRFYENKTAVDAESEDSAVNLVDNILETVLSNTYLTMSNQFSTEAHDEGSVTVDTKVGKLDESDHSVEILVEDRDEIILSDEPFDVEYSQDDVDAYVINEIPVTAFVSDGKRLFPGISRPLEAETDPVDIPVGHVAVRLGVNDAGRFAECCISRNENDFGWILPYQVLSKFHRGIGRSLEILDLAGVTLNNGARGPAITLTVQQQNGPNISVDITPKLSLPRDILNITHFKWPRKDTTKWLSRSKVKRVAGEPLYLVPKGDKYWKISFANLESELLDDIDDKKETWRKECLKIIKKKLLQWKSKSRAGLKGLSSYLLKTTLLWLCEILPDDQYWSRDQLANRYLNFLQELEHRLERRSLGEYFNPSVNLLEHKTDEDIEELRTFLLEEIENLTEKQDGAE